MADFLDFIRTQWAVLPIVPTRSTVAGGTYIVTGANTGLGFECAKHFVSMGADRVILAVRSLERGNTALAAIRRETGRSETGEVWELDLASLDSVEAFADRLKTLDRVDALVANASIALDTVSFADGLETSLMVNVLGTSLLAVRAIPKLQDSAKAFGITPHLVIVSSGAAFEANGILGNTGGNLFEALSKKDTSLDRRYQLTKLLQIYAVRELAGLFPVSKTGVVINVVNPGLCTTELSRHVGYVLRVQIYLMRLLLARTSEQGSRTLLHAAVAGVESHGKYVSDCEIKDQSIPTWMREVSGHREQERAWLDLVETLENRGHRIEVPKLQA